MAASISGSSSTCSRARSSGRKLFDRLNLVNASAQTVEIAQRTLSAICHATGRMQVQDSQELHLIPMIADVTIRPPKNGYGESNKVHYLPLDRGAGAQPRPQSPAPTAATAGRAPECARRRLRLGPLEALIGFDTASGERSGRRAIAIT